MNDAQNKQKRYQATRNVTLVGLIVNLLLSFAQFLGGFLSHSHALIADGVHTLSDLISDFVVLIAAKIANQDPDDDHPYGHGRFETLATVILGLALAGVAIGIIINAISRLLNPETLSQPTPIALLFVALAIIAKEALFQYTLIVAKRINSKMLKANAWHHRSDAISSLLVAIGVAGSIFLEIPWLDVAAAIIVSAMIFYMGLKLILDSTMELVDTAWDAEKTAEMKDFIGNIEGVDHMHLLRTRKMGNAVLADVHIQVNPYLSVSEGHYIAEKVMQQLKLEFKELTDITVHIDPEDDEIAALSNKLPSRQEIIAQIYPYILEAKLQESVKNITLHYINGYIEVEILLNQSHSETTLFTLKEQCENIKEIKSLSILNSI